MLFLIMKFCNSSKLQISKSGKSLKIKFTTLYDRESSLISDPSCPFDPVINTLILYLVKGVSNSEKNGSFESFSETKTSLSFILH